MNLLMLTLIMFTGPMHIPVKRLITSPALQERLELKADQIEKIENIWYEGRKKLIDLQSKRQKILLSIQKEMNGEDVNLENLRKLYDELGDVISKIKFTHAEMMLKVRGILTKDQLVRIEEARWRRHRRHLPPVQR